MATVGLDPAAWSGRRVLLTGHNGFKGSWLALWLAEMGAEVTGFSAPPRGGPSLYEAARVSELVASVDGDIRHAAAVRAAFEQAEPEVVLHLAAQPIVRRSYADPAETYGINVMGTVNVLDAVRASDSVRAVVVVTSDKCYLNRGWEWGYREYESLGGEDPYSSSKACQELVAQAYAHSYFSERGDRPRLGTARAGNVIGGGDWGQDRLVPDAMRAALAGDPVEVRNPAATRPWQHALNPLSGYLLLAQRLIEDGHDVADAWNFGPPDEDARTVGWIVERLASLWPGGIEITGTTELDAPPEANVLKLDSSRARAHLGWKPAWDLDEALQTVVDWYSAHGDGADMRDVTLGQIRSFAAATAG
jgi:CDP-glucose 4,6-dehydratase